MIHPGIPPVMREFAETTIELIQARRAEPRDDLISVWARTPGWDVRHILDETILVLDGGAETTRTVIGSMIRELALQPDQRRILTERPGLLATTAVEEFIRWVSPILNMRRTATVRPRAGTASGSGPATRSCCCTGRPTVTRVRFPTRTCST